MRKAKSIRIVVLLVILIGASSLFFMARIPLRTQESLSVSAKQVLQNIVNEVLGDPQSKALVRDVKLIKLERNKYQGVATISFLDDERQFDVTVLTDGKNIMCRFDNAYALRVFLTDIAVLERSVKSLIQKDLSGAIQYLGWSDDVVTVSEVKLNKFSKNRNIYVGKAKINFKPLEIDGKKVETKVTVDHLGARGVPVTYEYFIDVQVTTEEPNDDKFLYKYDSEQLSLAIADRLDLIRQAVTAAYQE